MTLTSDRSTRLRTAALLAGLAVVGALPAAAQGGDFASHPTELWERLENSSLEQGRYSVLIDLDQNKLFFRKGEVTLWSAPVGTGTGMRLKADDREWKFSTPKGVYHVQYKEQNPVWIAPEWYFVENGLPVPPEGDRRRSFPGGLGAAAVYFDRELAIHGTNKPDLLGQRVSHGCIRLSNRDALRLFHNVQVGTEIIIVGGDSVRERVVTPERLQAEKAAATFDPTRPAPRDPLLEEWKAMPTEELLFVLENELGLEAESSRWTEVAAILLERALQKDDSHALAGLMRGLASAPNPRVEREYATFLADAYVRGPMQTLVTLTGLGWAEREAAARAIVGATMHLFHSTFDAPGAPWPTSRIPRSAVDPAGWRGWDVIAEAEAEFRQTT